MSLPQIFARRRRQDAGSRPEFYIYDKVDVGLRIQIVQVLQEAIGPSFESSFSTPPGAHIYAELVRTYRKEKQRFFLGKSNLAHPQEEFFTWIVAEEDVELCLSGIESAMYAIDHYIRENLYLFREYIVSSPDRAIAEINGRFDEAGVGFQYVNGHLIEVRSQLVHSEVVVPALTLLTEKRFQAAEVEYRSAHALLRESKFEQSLVQCCKALESVLKVIAIGRNWAVGPNDPIKKYFDQAYTAGFIPEYLQAEFSALRALLESSVPAVRNRMGGHGAGSEIREVPKHLASFQLHQTAAAILFLVEQDRSAG